MGQGNEAQREKALRLRTGSFWASLLPGLSSLPALSQSWSLVKVMVQAGTGDGYLLGLSFLREALAFLGQMH